MLVHEYLRRAVTATPGAVAVIDGRTSITYAELAHRAWRFGWVLVCAGVRPGDRVVLALENSIDFVACYFGALEAGAVVVPLPPGSRSDRLVVACADCQPVACVADAGAADLLGRNAPASLRLLLTGGSLKQALDAAPSARLDVKRIDQDLAAIVYTSGSTGAPRGVMLTHLNICSNTESILKYLRLTRHDRVLVVLPFFYVYGLSLLHTHIAAGGSLVLVNSLAFPNVVVDAMRRHSVTGFAGVPSTFALMLQRSNLGRVPLPDLRYATQAGGPMPPARIRQWMMAMPKVPLFVMYGATEASARLAYLDPTELQSHVGSIGKAIPNVELRLLKDDGREAQPGEVGEIVARGSNISCGYWNHPQETRARFGPEGFHTGDLAVRDDDGYFYVVGRQGDMLKVGGHRVSAREIEDALCEYPGVYEAAVVAVEHEVLGHAPAAFVALQDGITAADVMAHCRAHLPDHKVPVEIVARAELPKNAAGKVDKGQLRPLLERRMPPSGRDMAVAGV